MNKKSSASILPARCLTHLCDERCDGHIVPGGTTMFDIMCYLNNPLEPLRAIQMWEWHITLPKPTHLSGMFMICRDESNVGLSIRDFGFRSQSVFRRDFSLKISPDLTLQHVLYGCYEYFRGISFQELAVAVMGSRLIVHRMHP